MKQPLSIAVSKSGSSSILIHPDLQLDKKDLQECIIEFTTSLLVVTNELIDLLF